MDKIIKPWRLFVILFLIVAMTAVFVVTLYRLQIVEGASYYAQSQNFVSTTVTVPAARGEILDRYGRVLVSNKVVNDITIDTTSLFEQEDPNAVILELARAVTDSGAEYTDTLPITKEAPFAYVDNMTDTQRTRLAAYLKMNKLSDATTAVELMAYFRKAFKIDDNYSSEDMRTIAGIRYEIKTRYIANVDYVFAENVSIDLITKLMERNVPGFNVVNSYKREYNTKYAAHLLGSVGLMDPDEYETFKEQGYLMNAVVGKSGAEKAFEQYLHSTDGQAVITKTRGGTVVNTRYTKNPEPGNNISLTIDLGLQETAENALASFIESNNAVRESENAALRAMGATKDVKDLISGGAIVAVNVKTGEPLCLASYPTYDLSTYSQNAAELGKEKNAPLLNRALMGLYAPGSTFKPVTAIACLSEGIITPGATIYDKGKFTKYAKSESDYAPECWIYPRATHGYVNATKAIEVSCNYYFYTVGDMLGIDKLSDYAARFGLGEPTGIELSENTGVMASRAEKEKNGQTWVVGDTLQAAIGQSDSVFTPLQIANCIATVANNGTRYKTTMLKSVRSYDYAKDIYKRSPEVAASVTTDQSYYDAVHQGLYDVANSADGTAYQVFGSYDVKVAAKTGTAQLGEGITNNAIFVCYAPYDDPEIALAVVIEKGNAGSAIATLAKQVLDYYFSFKNNSEVYENENVLLK